MMILVLKYDFGQNHFSVGLICCSAGRAMTVLSEVARGETVVVGEHFCLSVSLLSGKKSHL